MPFQKNPYVVEDLDGWHPLTDDPIYEELITFWAGKPVTVGSAVAGGPSSRRDAR
jgi:hypothetical protein